MDGRHDQRSVNAAARGFFNQGFDLEALHRTARARGYHVELALEPRALRVRSGSRVLACAALDGLEPADLRWGASVCRVLLPDPARV